MRKFLLLFISFNLLAGFCFGQRFLALDVYGISRLKRIKFFPGDEIRFKMKNDHTLYKGEITVLGDSSFDIEGMNVPLKIVTRIYVDKGNFLTKDIASFLFDAGVGFIILNTLNNALNNITPILDKRAVIIGGSLALAGEAMRLSAKKRYRIGENRQLKIIDTNP
jgi:hypothetical protein